MRGRASIVAALVACAVASAVASAVAGPAPGLPAAAATAAQTISANPRAYRAWLRREIDKDLAELYRVASEIVGALDPAAPGDLKKAAGWASKVDDLAHDVWNNVQLRKPNRERPRREPGLRPRALEAARADAEQARSLVRSVARDLAAERRLGRVDVKRRLRLLEDLERIERIGHQLEVDLKQR